MAENKDNENKERVLKLAKEHNVKFIRFCR